MDFEKRIEKLNEMIAEAYNIVFFTGAGISTNSGIPDFRSDDGLYNTASGIPIASPEYMLSDDCLHKHPSEFYKYIRKNLNFETAEPNIAHLKISELGLTRNVSVATQNIDGLHEKANTKNVFAIHGTMSKFYCPECGNDIFTPATVMNGFYDDDNNIPKCPQCEYGVIRPDIVLYGEGLSEPAWSCANDAAYYCDLMIVVGTSLTVYPAAYIPMNCKGKLVIINREDTFLNKNADLIFNENIKEVFENVKIP